MAMTSAWRDVNQEESFDEAFDGCIGMNCRRTDVYNQAQKRMGASGATLYGSHAKMSQEDTPRSKTATAKYQSFELGPVATQGELPGVVPLGNQPKIGWGSQPGYRDPLVADDSHLRFVQNGKRFAMKHAPSGPVASMKLMQNGGFSSVRDIL